MERGGGYLGIHSACDTENRWGWYHQLIGTYFRDHILLPLPIQEAKITIEDQGHSATLGLPKIWTKKDEWYNFVENVRGKKGIHVLMSLDEQSYQHWIPDAMAGDHPICWINQDAKGRSFYTAIGHTTETYSDTIALKHLEGALKWTGKL